MSAFPRGRLIAHAGGALEGRKYTNSAEAFDNAARLVSLIEQDVCDAVDGLIVAHDGLEHAYGIKRPFSEITTANFATRKYAGAFQAMTLADLLTRLKDTDASVVLDIKTSAPEGYARALSEIMAHCTRLGVTDRTIVQIYSEHDFDCARKLGLEHVILALWKNFGNVWSPECRACIDYCFSPDHAGFRALSMAARHFWKDNRFAADKLARYAFGKTDMVFLHGQPETAERELLARGFGLFTHNPETLSGLIQGGLPPT